MKRFCKSGEKRRSQMNTLKVQQRGDIPAYAGVCSWCSCVYDTLGRRTRCLTEEQMAILKAKGLKSRGMCGTCRTVALKAAAVKNQRLDERTKDFGAKGDFEEPGFEEGGVR